MKLYFSRTLLLTLLTGLTPLLAASTTDTLSKGFLHPPATARPWVYWWWLDSNASRVGITRDLEALKRQGIAGALVFDAGAGHGTPVGPAFMSEPWRALFKYAVQEAHRIGISLSFNICSGWDCGGPWVTPEHALKRLTWSELKVRGPASFSELLTKPPATDGFYRDIAVLAFPTSDSLQSASCLNLTDRLASSGELTWNVPAGDWLLLRFGQTLYGGGEGKTKFSSPGGQGYEIDFLSAEALDQHFTETAAKVVADIQSLAGKTLLYFHDDSWECGEPNWTPAMPSEFQQRRGYDLVPFLPVLAGKTVNTPEISARFRRDFRRTIADLVAENHYGRLRELSRRFGMGVHAESGGPFFVPVMDPLMNLGRNDIPMGEYWIRRSEPDGPIPFADQYAICDTVKQAATAAHIYGKRLCQAEAFTNMGRNWEEDPFMLKPIGDRAFCAGLTRNMLCFYVHQPYLDLKPGYEWPEAGTHFDRNITWWNQMHAFTEYLTRCQFLLQQGRFVADVCYFAGDDMPCYVPARTQMKPSLPVGYDCDTVNTEVLLTRLTVVNGRLTLPDLMSYRLLVLPDRTSMTPEVLRKLAAFIETGATVLGPKPVRSPSLRRYPACDAEVQDLADKIWRGCDGTNVSENTYGEGRVVWGRSLADVLTSNLIKPDFAFISARSDTELDYIHRQVGTTDLYFVSNQKDQPATAACTFRVAGRQPELWDAVTGEIRDAQAFDSTQDGRTIVPLEFPPRGSVFMVFRRPVSRTQTVPWANYPNFSPVLDLRGPWNVQFDPQFGGPSVAEFPELVSWTSRQEPGIRYYSGKATYRKPFSLATVRLAKEDRVFLDLGELKNLAEVRLNGKNLGVLWTRPFRADITSAVRSGDNQLEIDIINLWPNRLIGDQFLPENKRFTKTNVQKFKQGTPLLESGLLGPVTILRANSAHH